MKRTILALAVVAIGLASCGPKKVEQRKNVIVEKKQVNPLSKDKRLDTIRHLVHKHKFTMGIERFRPEMSYTELKDLRGFTSRKIDSMFNRIQSGNGTAYDVYVLRKTIFTFFNIFDELLKKPAYYDSLTEERLSNNLAVIQHRHECVEDEFWKQIASTVRVIEVPRSADKGLKYKPRTDWDSDNGPTLNSRMQDEINSRIQQMNSIDRSPSGSAYSAQARATYVNPYGGIR